MFNSPQIQLMFQQREVEAYAYKFNSFKQQDLLYILYFSSIWKISTRVLVPSNFFFFRKCISLFFVNILKFHIIQKYF